DRGGELRARREGVPLAVDERRRRDEMREMRGAKGRRLLRRVERIGEEEERIGGTGLFRREKARLAAAVGMAAEKKRPRDEGAERGGGRAQPRPIRGRVGPARRARCAALAERQIAAEDAIPGLGERRGHRN